MKVRRNVVQLVLTVSVIVGTFVWTLLGDDRPVLGLDLQGGVSIVLFPVEGSDTSSLDTAADIIRNRVDALGIAEPEVNRQGDTIVVDLPGVKDRARAEELVGQTAELRFRLVQSQLPWEIPDDATTTVPGGATTTTGGAPTSVEGTTTTTAAVAPTTTADGDAAGTPIDAAPDRRGTPGADRHDSRPAGDRRTRRDLDDRTGRHDHDGAARLQLRGPGGVTGGEPRGRDGVAARARHRR
ncbi:MAG: hypothetical protein KatS3mg010_0639 [Acidimicrobiia bacterium]|nr:MAG: hypothetical protein KatS3mg010_0639 [Acidimicrobiia bacterium]